MWILEKIRKAPLAPVLRGEGSGVGDQKTRKKSPPHPNPSPPEYRGEGLLGRPFRPFMFRLPGGPPIV